MSRHTSSHYQKDEILYPSLPFFFRHILCFLWHLCFSRSLFNSLKWKIHLCHLRCGWVSEISTIKCGLWWLSEGEEKAGAGAQKERRRKRRKGQTDFIFSAAKRYLLALSTHWTYAVALCHLKQIFQLKLKFSLLIFANAIFPFFFFSTCMRNW